MVEQGRGVGGMVRDADGRRGAGASDPATLVVPDELVAVGERRFRQQRQEAVGDDGADEQHGFPPLRSPRSPDLGRSRLRSAWVLLVAAGFVVRQPIGVSKTITAVTSTVTAPVAARPHRTALRMLACND